MPNMPDATGSVQDRIRLARPPRFYVWVGVASALSVLLGFGTSLHERASSEPLSTLVAVHGLLFFAWVGVFIIQAALAGAGHVRLHRMLGALGLLAAALMLAVGFVTAVAAAGRGYNPGNLFPDALGFLAIPMGDLVVFGGFVSLAAAFRQSPEVHKRLMVLALVGGLVPASFTRLPFVASNSLAVTAVTVAFLAAGPIFDRVYYSRIHSAYKWGAPFAFASLPVRIVLGRTEFWRAAATWLVS